MKERKAVVQAKMHAAKEEAFQQPSKLKKWRQKKAYTKSYGLLEGGDPKSFTFPSFSSSEHTPKDHSTISALQFKEKAKLEKFTLKSIG